MLIVFPKKRLRRRRFHLIPNASDSFNHVLIILQFLPDVPDVDVHSPRLPVKLIAPDAIEQVVPCEHLPRCGGEGFQQLKLLECQLQLLAVVVSFIIVAINGQGTELDDAGRIVWLRTPAEDGF